MRADPTLATILGQTVEATLAGPWRSTKGPELTGISGTDWWYADLLVLLSDGSILSMGTSEGTLLSEIPRGASPVEPRSDIDEACIGRRIVDLLTTAESAPSLFLMLDGGFYLEHSSLPGGSAHIFGHLREWDPEELKEEAVSLISGERRTWRSLVAWSSPSEP